MKFEEINLPKRFKEEFEGNILLEPPDTTNDQKEVWSTVFSGQYLLPTLNQFTSLFKLFSPKLDYSKIDTWVSPEEWGEVIPHLKKGFRIWDTPIREGVIRYEPDFDLPESAPSETKANSVFILHKNIAATIEDIAEGTDFYYLVDKETGKRECVRGPMYCPITKQEQFNEQLSIIQSNPPLFTGNTKGYFMRYNYITSFGGRLREGNYLFHYGRKKSELNKLLKKFFSEETQNIHIKFESLEYDTVYKECCDYARLNSLIAHPKRRDFGEETFAHITLVEEESWKGYLSAPRILVKNSKKN